MNTEHDVSAQSHLPPEVQHLIISCLDVKTLFRLLLTCHHYKHIISTDCQHLWKAHLDERWEHGKLIPKQFRDEKIEWSRRNGWCLHRMEGPQLEDTEGKDKWFDEYLYRSKLDTMAERWMADIKVHRDMRSNLHKLLRYGEDVYDIVVKDFYNRKHIVDLGRCLAYQEWRFIHDSGVDTCLEDGAVAFAKFFTSHDVGAMVDYYLDEMAVWLRKRLQQRFGKPYSTGSETMYPIRDVLVYMSYLFGATPSNAEDSFENPFQGNTADYYNPGNSLIDVVIEERKGIPISLAVIYVAVVRRACEIELDVVGLPGHIVVGIPEELSSERIFVDPFNSGRIMTVADSREIVNRYNVTFHDRMLDPISQVDVWQRMIRNLIHAISAPIIDDHESSEWSTVLPLTLFLVDEMQRITCFEELLDHEHWRLHSLDPRYLR
ncbi:hypothetical protein ACHAXN_007216 [Cyclotella atomus]